MIINWLQRNRLNFYTGYSVNRLLTTKVLGSPLATIEYSRVTLPKKMVLPPPGWRPMATFITNLCLKISRLSKQPAQIAAEHETENNVGATSSNGQSRERRMFSSNGGEAKENHRTLLIESKEREGVRVRNIARVC